MDTTTPFASTAEAGPLAGTISCEIVTLHKKHFGRGPVRVRTHLLDDCVLVLMHGGLGPLEPTLLEAGQVDLVARMRVVVNTTFGREYTRMIEKLLGRKVIGFMSGSQHDPDFECQVCVLEPAAWESQEARRDGQVLAGATHRSLDRE